MPPDKFTGTPDEISFVRERKPRPGGPRKIMFDEGDDDFPEISATVERGVWKANDDALQGALQNYTDAHTELDDEDLEKFALEKFGGFLEGSEA